MQNLHSRVSLQANHHAGETVQVYGGKVRAFKIPSDGHCLFSALLHQLHLHGLGGSLPGAPNHAHQVAELRRRVVQYIQDRLGAQRLEWEECLDVIVEDMPDMYPSLNEAGEPVPLEQRVESFLADLAGSAWGGDETLRAFAELEGVSIVVHNEGTDFPCQMIQPEDSAIRCGLAVVYRTGLPGTRNHYDSCLCSLPNS